jgi:hypothetical protein
MNLIALTDQSDSKLGVLITLQMILWNNVILSIKSNVQWFAMDEDKWILGASTIIQSAGVAFE